jgi:hypothetical protein
MLLDFFIPKVGFFVFHSLKIFDIILPLTHFETLHSECIINLFMNDSLMRGCDDYLSLFIDADFSMINHIWLVVKQIKTLVFSSLNHEESPLLKVNDIHSVYLDNMLKRFSGSGGV